MLSPLGLLFGLCLHVSCSLAMSESQFYEAMLTASEFETNVRQSGLEKNTRADKYKPGLPGGFTCPVLAPSATKPTNARFVRPSDIKVIGALGDSLTAANGVKAWTVAGVLKQYRGLSWSMGGDKDVNSVLTLANILKKYNPKLYGYSVGSSYSQDTKDAFYNVARAGNTAADLIAQSHNLVKKVLADKNQHEWKVITIFIGGNDVCEYCNDRVLHSPENYKKNIVNSINNIYNNFTNTIINLVGPLDMTEIAKVPDGLACDAVHAFVCDCVYNKSDTEYAGRMSRLYLQQIQEIVSESTQVWPRADFAVSLQPQFTGGKMPLDEKGNVDLDFFAPDCFHFSQIGHETAAITLWNNMLKPADKRATNMPYGERVMDCPTEASPYIFI